MSVWTRKTGPRPLQVEGRGSGGGGRWGRAADRSPGPERNVLGQRGALREEQGRSREAAGRRRGARGALGGLPPLLLGKRVGPDDALSPSPSVVGPGPRVQRHSQREAGAGL